MKARKILVSLAALALVAAISIGGTLAYLTSKDTVTNTFTVGNVSITLDEAKVNEDGTKVAQVEGKEVRTDKNDYHLLPGHTYVKDPTIHVDPKSEDCFIRAKVTLTNADEWVAIAAKYAEGKVENIITGTDDDIWWVSQPTVDKESNTVTYTFVYKNETKAESLKRVWQAGTDEADLVLFSEIVIPDGLTNDELKGVADTTITVVAEAIQADGFVESSNNEAKAAEAFGNAMKALDAQKA